MGEGDERARFPCLPGKGCGLLLPHVRNVHLNITSAIEPRCQ